jgi:4-amino-4-deoxy-L-arabinose transferase-like glycosyltransferase
MTIPRWQPLALVAFACTALLLFLGSRGLNEPDEGRYAEVGREMAVSGEWLVPHLNGIPHFQKPPLLYWATAASIRVFGVNEWAARLPSALSALGIVLLTYWIGSLLFGKRTGVAAGLVLLSTLGFFVAARLLTPDMFMTFWITAAIACLVKFGRGGGRLWAWLFFAAMGLGFLTKGPMALVVPISAAVSWQFSRRRTVAPLRLPWVRGVVLMLGIGLSWFIVLSIRDPDLFSYFAGDELVKRFASKSHGRSKPFWFFAWVLPAALFPWTFFLLIMLGGKVAAWRRGWRPRPEQALLLGWVGIPLMILSLSGSKLPTYVIPLFPALALAIGHWTRSRENHRLWNVGIVTTIVGLGAITLGIEAIEHTAQVDLPDSYMIMPGLLACLVLMRHHPVSTRLVVALSTVVVWLAGVENLEKLSSQLEQQASVKPLAVYLRSAPDFPQATIFACEVRAHGWEFYLERLTHMTRDDADVVLRLTPEQESRMIRNASRCEAAMLAKAPAYGLVRTERFARSFSPEKWKVLADNGDFLLIGTKDSALQPE